MAVLPILSADSPSLREKARKVKRIASIQKLIDDMIETMRDTSGVGLAAPQIGVPLRVIVVEIPEQELLVLVNPEVVKKSGERLVEEGCLCLPEYRGEVKRSFSVVVKGRDRLGKEIRVRGEDLLAQALEHEIDHLNGVLYFDHLESMDQLRKVEPPAAEEEPSQAI